MKILECFGQSETLELAWKVRRQVFIVEQNVPETIERDSVDARAWHILLIDSEPVATGRLFELKEGLFSIGRVAVLREYRGTGLGQQVMKLLLNKAWGLNAKTVEIHAQVQAKAFYEELGFVDQGEVFIEAGIEHIIMSINHPEL